MPQADIFKYSYKLRVYRDDKTFKEFNVTHVNPFYTTMMTIDQQFNVKIYHNKKYNQTEGNLRFQIKNNGQVVVEIKNVTSNFTINKNSLYNTNNTNGGVLYAYLEEYGTTQDFDRIDLQTKLFLMPKSALDFRLVTSKDIYEPGEKVSLAIKPLN